MATYLAEAIGTMTLILFGDGVVANVVLAKNKGNSSGWIVITTGWGLAVAMSVYAVGWISGAHINPAVTIGLAAIGSFSWALVPGYIIAQMIGAFVGGVLVYLTYKQHFDATEDVGAKLAVFSTGPAIRGTGWNLFTEIIGTAVLLFGILGIGHTMGGAGGIMQTVNSGMNPFVVGFLIFAIGLSLGGPTGYAINPARDLGPRLAHAVLPIKNKGSNDWGYSWIPVVGPIIGGLLGAFFWTFVQGLT
ncbi:MAG: aquaporin family protein [Cytophagales bacterium]|nr:aquaporin family protein [Cytophagales bacterium]